MPQTYYALTEDEVRILQDLIAKSRRTVVNTVNRPAVPPVVSQPRGFYVGRAPADGIAGRTGTFGPDSVGTGSGTGTGVSSTFENEVSSGECSVWAITPREDGVFELTLQDFALTVYNPSAGFIDGDAWLDLSLDDYGCWIGTVLDGVSGSLTVETSSGSVIVINVTDIVINDSTFGGLTAVDLGGGQVRLSAKDSSYTQSGIINKSAQVMGQGRKEFRDEIRQTDLLDFAVYASLTMAEGPIQGLGADAHCWSVSTTDDSNMLGGAATLAVRGSDGKVRWVIGAGSVPGTGSVSGPAIACYSVIDEIASYPFAVMYDGINTTDLMGNKYRGGVIYFLGAGPAADFSINNHKLTNVSDPTSALDAVNLETLLTYVEGLDAKGQCQYCSTVPLPSNTYANGSSGVGATLTATGNGALVVDSVTILSTSLRILVAGEGTASHNGWYTVTTVGDGSHPYELTRATPDDESVEMGPGYLTAVEASSSLTPGTVNNGKVFISIAPKPFTVGTSSITFASVGNTYVADETTLTLTGNVFSIKTQTGTGSIVCMSVGPALTGVPTAPTAAADTNTTQLATTAYVVGQAGSSTPAANSGSGTVGTSKKYARDDHAHPAVGNQGTGVTTTSEGTLAAAGSAQGDAAAIVTDNVVVSGADGTKGVILPATAGARIYVENSDATHNLKVYPSSGAAIGTSGTNNPTVLPGTNKLFYIRVSSTQWRTITITA